jgi:hypothetical protein
MDDWREADPEHRAKASLEWDPRFGDRAQELTIVSHLAIPDEITQALQAALLTDEELAEGEQAWARYPDPFGEWHQCRTRSGKMFKDRLDVACWRGVRELPV